MIPELSIRDRAGVTMILAEQKVDFACRNRRMGGSIGQNWLGQWHTALTAYY
jgi:hypothetical protein